MGNISDKDTDQVRKGGHSYLRGLTERQRILIRGILEEHCPEARRNGIGYSGCRTPGDESPYKGWSIYRVPSTLNPPTTLRVLHRGIDGKLIQVFSITENGVTK